jgi:hypothetical protein
MTHMKVGDQVEVIAIPKSLPSGMGTQGLFEACIGGLFPIEGIDNGLLELHVGEVVGKEAFMHSIWIEASCVLPRPYAPKVVLQLPISNPDRLEPFVEACLRDGVDLIAIVGEGASKIDGLIDEIVVVTGRIGAAF